MNKFLKISAFCVMALAASAVASEMPFPQIEGGKVTLRAKNSPYALEQGMVFSSTDTLVVEPGVIVLMGEYAKLTLRGPVMVNGTDSNRVVFRSADSNESWNGIHFISNSKPFDVKNLTVENAFRNTVFRSRGIFENVQFVNNYYGLWVDEVPELLLSHCEFTRNRFALSVRAGKVVAQESQITNNVYGLYLEAGGNFEGDLAAINGNLETDVRKESEDLAGQGKRVSRSIWQRIETGF